MINTIRGFYSSGDFEMTRSLLAQCLKKYDLLADNEKSFVAGMFMNLNESDKTLSLIKEEISLENLSDESEESLKRQVYLAQIKIKMHSINVGARILNNVLSVVEKRIENFSTAALQAICNNAASNLRILGDDETILRIEKYYPYPETLELRDYLFRIEVFRAKISLGKTLEQDIDENLQKMFQDAPQSKILTYIIAMHKFEIKMSSGSLTLDDCNCIEEKLTQANPLPTHQAYFYYLIGYAKFLSMDIAAALPFFQKALSLSQSLIEKHSIIFWLNKIAPETIPLVEQVLLKCSPYNSIESYLSGNRYTSICPSDLPRYLLESAKNSISPEKHDCWVISKNEITLKNYLKIEDLNTKLDLYSGILIENGQVSKILTSLRAKLIRIIYGSGSLGAHVSYLIDVIFDGTYYFYESPHLRLKNLIAEITKLGISIIRNKNTYFYDFEKNNFNVIFPCDHSFLGPLIYLTRSHQSINRKIIEIKLNIKPSTASSYLKQWREKGLVKKDDTNKYGEFLTNADSMEEIASNEDF